jgi:hypothetical protein
MKPETCNPKPESTDIIPESGYPSDKALANIEANKMEAP